MAIPSPTHWHATDKPQARRSAEDSTLAEMSARPVPGGRPFPKIRHADERAQWTAEKIGAEQRSEAPWAAMTKHALSSSRMSRCIQGNVRPSDEQSRSRFVGSLMTWNRQAADRHCAMQPRNWREVVDFWPRITCTALRTIVGGLPGKRPLGEVETGLKNPAVHQFLKCAV